MTNAQRDLLRQMLDSNLALVQRDSLSDQRFLLVDAATLDLSNATPVNRSTARSLSDRRDVVRFDAQASNNTRRVFRAVAPKEA